MKHILAFLLHHANLSCRSEQFYAIKDQLLNKYGAVIGYDIQHIEGKKCFACHGTGTYVGYHWSGDLWEDACDRCYNGWYKRPMWILLSRKKFGRYVFHKPVKREYSVKNPFTPSENWGKIDGYVDHRYSRYSFLAVLILFLIYNRSAARKYFYEMGLGWRTYWWYPQNWLYVVAHFARYKRDAYPFKKWREKNVERAVIKRYQQETQLPF
jgi:hypothetical protein